MGEETASPVCTAQNLHHVCIAVRDIEGTLKLYGNLFNVEQPEVQVIQDQGVKAALVKIGGTELEFIEPTDTSGGVARFIEQKGEGLHHICFEVDDLQMTLDRMSGQGIELIDKIPRKGLAGMIAFLHPRSTRGTLVELVDKGTTGR